MAGQPFLGQALRDGNLSAEGWVEFNEEELPVKGSPVRLVDGTITYEALGEFKHIPKDAWLWSNIDWLENKLTTDEETFAAVQLVTESMLGLYPKPNIPKVIVGVVPIYGETVVIEDDDESEASRGSENSPALAFKARQRGRPPKVSMLSIKDIVVNYLSWQDHQGNLPDKEEALIAFTQEFVANSFNDDLPRSTAQTYIAAMRAHRSREVASNTNVLLTAGK